MSAVVRHKSPRLTIGVDAGPQFSTPRLAGPASHEVFNTTPIPSTERVRETQSLSDWRQAPTAANILDVGFGHLCSCLLAWQYMDIFDTTVLVLNIPPSLPCRCITGSLRFCCPSNCCCLMFGFIIQSTPFLMPRCNADCNPKHHASNFPSRHQLLLYLFPLCPVSCNMAFLLVKTL